MTYAREQIDAALDKIHAGVTAYQVCKDTGVPERTVYSWLSAYNGPKYAKLRHLRRRAFAVVLEHYRNIRATIGVPGAQDYSQTTGGSGAQFASTDIGHQLIDYTVDFEKTAADVLTPAEREWLFQNLDPDMTVQSVGFMYMQERLGRAFIARQLHPIKKYFTVNKEKHGKSRL